MSRTAEMLQRLRQFWQRLFGSSPTNSIPLDASVLEDRVLYSATMMPMEWVDVQEGMDGQIDQIDDLVASEIQNDGSIDVATFTENPDLFASLDSALLAIGADSGSESVELDGSAISQVEVVFVDSSVVDYQLIVEDLRQQSFDGTRLEVAIIESGADGLSQVSQWLSDCESRVDAIHLITQEQTNRSSLAVPGWMLKLLNNMRTSLDLGTITLARALISRSMAAT